LITATNDGKESKELLTERKDQEKKMKRTTATVAILAIAFLITSARVTSAHGVTARGLRPDVFQQNLADPQSQGVQLTEEFHQSYPLSANGRVSIENINGGVRISVWDQNEVKVDAVKKAYQQERLNEAKIEVTNTADSVRIKTMYPERDQTFSDNERRRYNNPATIEYTLTIPRKARLDSAELVNGSLEIEGLEGDVRAACVNGHIKASGLTGDVKLSTVNGGVEASMTRLDESKAVSLNSVNGTIVLNIPANGSAQIRANTVHGAITNDFGLQVNDGQYVGHDLSGQIGSGGPRVHLSNVNGPISIKRS
jgi:DUF4097 and DUF4098 domain-containing protein YvlB